MRSFVDLHAPLILRLARASAGSRDEAFEVAQEVVVTLLAAHARGRLDPAAIENPEAYLRVAVRHAVVRGRRSRDARRISDDALLEELPSPTANPEETRRSAIDARRWLETLKSRLRPRDAVAFALLVEDGLDIEEVATALGTTANNVYQMRHRILAAAKALQDEMPSSSRGAGEGAR